MAVLLAAVVAPSAGAWNSYPRIDDALRHFDSRPDSYVRCLTDDEAASYRYSPNETSIIYDNGRWVRPGLWLSLDAGVCEEMLGVLDTPADYLGDAIHNETAAEQFLVFTHEIGHMRGGKYWRSESRMWCFGINHVRGVMAYMGVPPDTIAMLWPYVLEQSRLWAYDPYRLLPCRLVS